MNESNHPPANPHADREAQLADGILDRDHGEDYNPNPEAVVEEQRARFEANNAQLRDDREELEDHYLPVVDRLTDEAAAAAMDPDHQAMLPHQREHTTHDPVANNAGREEVVSDIPPHLRDNAASVQPQRESKDVLHPNGPAVPVQNNSLRKDA